MNMKRLLPPILILLPLIGVSVFAGASPKKGKISEETKACLECHQAISPGIFRDWEKGRHAQMTPTEGLKAGKLGRRISSENIPAQLKGTVVGCAECHTLNPDKHKDTFEHNGYKVHTVVTPSDCAVCHTKEVKQYSQNIMARAYGNLKDNPVYSGLADLVNGLKTYKDKTMAHFQPDPETNAESCYHCHGTLVEVKGRHTRETAWGTMDFPILTGWPNQGVGRVNPDGSLGSCAACHTRHNFSLEMARKPYTCSQCHKGPDVPAAKVYSVSKHGNTFSALGKEWNFKNVPWKAGKDFTAPTCAVCHVSLIVNEEGAVIAERTHQMNDRLSWRLFGLIYAHPHPRSADTTIIRNKAGLPLPTELTGEPASDFLIDKKEQDKRRQTMQKVCLSCHSQSWVEGHFRRLENTIKTSNQMTLTATNLMNAAWEKGLVKGLTQKDSLFNEYFEKKWVEQWLFHANSIRYASAMMGADYGVFANGRWYLNKNIEEMEEWLKQKDR
jgi:ssDNA-binding Zn-finger/Zn-ribbon topoisomerase 1